MENELYKWSTENNDETNVERTGQVYSETDGNLGGFFLKDDTRGERIKKSIAARQRRKELKEIRHERELNMFDRLRSDRKKIKKMKKKGLHLK